MEQIEQQIEAKEPQKPTEEEKLVTERFSKAVELLASGDLTARLGGIYALERIAKDSEKDYWQVMEVLTAFVRDNVQIEKGAALSEKQTRIRQLAINISISFLMRTKSG